MLFRSTRLKQICVLDKIQFEDSALSRIASLAKGGLRDAEGLLDQAVNLGQGKVTDQTVRELSGAAPDELITDMLKQCALGNTPDVLLKAHQALENGADPEDMLSSLGELLRGTLLSKVCGADSPLLEGQVHLKSAYAELGGVLSEDQMLMLLQLFNTARRQMRDAVQTRLPLEMALIRASRAKDLVDLGKLVSALESGAQVPASRGSPQPGQPPDREGSRPNSQGRQAGTVENRPAALQESPVARAADAASAPADSGISAEQWSNIMSAVGSQKGGALLTSALSHSQSVRLDETTNVLTLGFAADQLFYRDSLEKPHNQATLLGILKQVLGKAVTVTLERVSGNARKAVVAPPARLQVRPTAAPQPVRQPVITQPDEIEESDVEFDDDGELPLPGPAQSGESDVAPQSLNNDEDSVEESDAPVRPPVAIPKASPVLRDPADLKAYEAHPLVKLVLKETGGAVISVQKK